MNRSQELTDVQRAMFAVMRQCTLVDDASGDRAEQLRRAYRLVALAKTVVTRIEQQ
jgi:hypothetical protein